MDNKLKEEIIEAAVERALLRLPYVMGSLIDSHFAMLSANKKFYEEHKELVNHKDVVASVVEEIDNQNPHIPYCEKLTKALPEISRRIGLMKNLNTQEVNRPSRDTNISLEFKGNGEL